MASKIFLRGVLPIAIFIPMGYLAKQVVFERHMYQSGTGLQLADHCNAPIGTEGYPSRLAYTGYPNLDYRMCALVTLFHALLDPAYRPLVAELMTALAAVTMIPFVEAVREKRFIFLRMPAAVGVLFQLFSFAVIMPIYYVAFILSGAAIGSPVKGRATKITQGSAEALFFALIAGYIIPTVYMVIFQDTTSTALWQGYPIIMALAQFVYLIIRPSSRYVESGYATIQAMYGLIFVTSAIFHIYYTWPLFLDIQQFQKILVPQLALGKRPLSLPEGVAAVIQWDAVFGIGSTLLVTFWFARGAKEMVPLFLWHILSSVVFGPGATIAGVLLFREARLNSRAAVEDKED
jgi:hypothetical protein